MCKNTDCRQAVLRSGRMALYEWQRCYSCLLSLLIKSQQKLKQLEDMPISVHDNANNYNWESVQPNRIIWKSMPMHNMNCSDGSKSVPLKIYGIPVPVICVRSATNTYVNSLRVERKHLSTLIDHSP